MNADFEMPLEEIFNVSLPPRPYPGLRPFEKKEWPIFFGRERMADAIVKVLVDKHLLVVHGDSGCGKSSIVRAAVLPRLEQENARAGLRWRTCTALPRETPLLNIAEALAGLDGTDPNSQRTIELRRALNFGQDAPAAIARILGADSSNNICILIDQFEELFSQARRHGPEEAKLLTQFLIAAHLQPQPGLYIVLTMRSEFLGACAHYSGFAEVVNSTQYLLPRMEHCDLIRAICEPAKLYNGTTSRELAERLIIDSGGSQDQLPLIQHGLMLLHRLNVPDTEKTPLEFPSWYLGLEHYNQEHRLAGLLSAHADEVFAHTQKDLGSHIVEDLFRALTDINAEGQAIRRPQTLRQLVAVTGADEQKVRTTLDAFRADGVSFLTPHDPFPLDDDELIDISHEALIRCWHKIADPVQGWLFKEFMDGLIWRTLLVEADSFERNPGNVIAPDITDERVLWLPRHNKIWAERYGKGWDCVKRLLDASAEARDRVREQKAAQDRQKVRSKTIKYSSAAAIIAIMAGGYAIYFMKELSTTNVVLEARTQQLETTTKQLETSDEKLNSTYNNIDLTLESALKKNPTLEKPLQEIKAELQLQRLQ